MSEIQEFEASEIPLGVTDSERDPVQSELSGDSVDVDITDSGRSITTYERAGHGVEIDVVDSGRSITTYTREGDPIDVPIAGSGLMVPVGVFDPLEVLVLNEDNEPIDGDPLWLLPRQHFPVASAVQNNQATLWLLAGFTYDRFQLIVQKNSTTLVWYEAIDANVRPSDEAVVLNFEESELPSGMFCGGKGIEMGGTLNIS